jgi:hypothetical protein
MRCSYVYRIQRTAFHHRAIKTPPARTPRAKL